MSWLLLPLLACTPAPEEVEEEEPACPEGEVDDGGACVPEACGIGTWGELPVDGDTRYVDAAAAEGGDGSAEAPFTSIQVALDRAAARGGGLVAVAAGTYVENLELFQEHADIHLAGRCSDLVVVDGSEGRADQSTILHWPGTYDTITYSGLSVTGGKNIGLWLYNSEAEVRDVAVYGNQVVGVVMQGTFGRFTLEDVAVFDNVPGAQGEFGYGLQVSHKSKVTAVGLELYGHEEANFLATSAGTEADLEDVRVTGGIRGLSCGEGAELVARDVSVEGTEGSAFVVSDGGRLEVTGFTVDGGHAEAGTGAEVSAGGTLVLEDGTIHDAGGIGIYAVLEGSAAELTDVVVTDPRDAGEEYSGIGLAVDGGAAVTATGLEVSGTQSIAVYVEYQSSLVADGLHIADYRSNGLVLNNESTAVIDDLVIAGGVPDEDGAADAVEVAWGSSLEVRGGEVRDALRGGVLVYGDGASVSLSDVHLDGVHRVDGDYGYGVHAWEGGVAELDRCTVQGTGYAALAAWEGDLVARDTTVRDTAPSGVDRVGAGAWVNGGGTMALEGVTLEGSTLVSLYAYGEGTELDLADVVVTETVPRDDGIGYGLQAAGGAVVQARGLEVRGSWGVGVGAADEGTSVVIEQSEISDTRLNAASASATGLITQKGAEILGREVVVEGTDGPGAYAAYGYPTLGCVGCTLRDNTFAGAVVHAAGMALVECVIEGNRADDNVGGGAGVVALGEWGESALTLRDSQVGSHPLAGVWLDGRGTHEIDGNRIAGGEGVALTDALTVHGDGLYATGGIHPWSGSSGLWIHDNTFEGAPQAGIFLHGASALIEGNSYSGNALDVVQQSCEEIPEVEISGESGDRAICDAPKQLVWSLDYDPYLTDLDVSE